MRGDYFNPDFYYKIVIYFRDCSQVLALSLLRAPVGVPAKPWGRRQNMMGSPGVITVIIIIKTDVFLLEGKESSPSPLFCSFLEKENHSPDFCSQPLWQTGLETPWPFSSPVGSHHK